ncbi:MAG: hypothetical protein CBC48_03480 [bacterium TMED88]|nr:hypothetical protein [Deltaproteobacteria bacterium]OUV35709.1 MAG: hypothetical protein CBC48_03480 [bacterium TMED88]
MSLIRNSTAFFSALLATPFLAVACAVRPTLRSNLGERLGGLPQGEPGAVWIHGASLGEARIVSLVSRELKKRGHRTFVSTQTEAGRSALRAESEAEEVGFAPFDHPWCVDRALDRIQPAALVLCEAEIWPVWIAAAASRGIPVGLVSARLSRTSLRRSRWVRRLMGRAIGRLSFIGARSEADAQGYVELGARAEVVRVTGDLKRSARPSVSVFPPDLRQIWPAAPVLIAASTHAGEETAALEALERLEGRGKSFHLILAPRHLERVEEVADELSARGRVFKRRSTARGRWDPGEVLLLDSHGELASLYASAGAVFVGGTLVRRGGHDPLEAVRGGCGVVVGPHTEHIREVLNVLIMQGLAVRITRPDELAEAWVKALNRSRDSVLAAAKDFDVAGDGIRTGTLDFVEALMKRRPS